MAAQKGTPEGLEYMLSCCTPGGQGRYHFGEMGYENIASLPGLSRWLPGWPTCPLMKQSITAKSQSNKNIFIGEPGMEPLPVPLFEVTACSSSSTPNSSSSPRQSNAWPYTIIKQRHNFDADWLNYLAQMLMYGHEPPHVMRGLASRHLWVTVHRPHSVQP